MSKYIYCQSIKNVYLFVSILMSQYSRWPLNNINPKLYLNRGVRSIFFALKPDCSTSFPIVQLTYILEREKAKTLIKIEFDEDRITAALKNSKNINERVRNLQVTSFGYLFVNFKFLGTIEFLVSIYGKILVFLSPNLDISYRSLYFKYCRPLCLGKSLI